MPPIPKKLEWVTQKVILRTNENKPINQIGEVWGPVVVHRNLRRKHKWNVSSITTGYIVAVMESEEESKRLAVQVVALFKKELQLLTPKAIRAAIPVWAHNWLKMCQAEGFCLDYQPFKEI